MTKTAVYEGSVNPAHGSFTCLSLSPSEILSGRILIRVEYSADSTGQEAIRYTFNGKARETLFVGSKGIYELDQLGGVTLRPLMEAAGPSTWGFVLPHSCSTLFLRPAALVQPQQVHGPFVGDGCSVGDPTCMGDAMRIGFSGTALNVQWRESIHTLTFAMGGKPMLQWSFGGEMDQGFPKTISYAESDYQGKVIATAQFERKSITANRPDLLLSDYIPSGNMTVEKQGSGYGPFSPRQDGDPWAFYQDYDKMWQAKESAKQPPHGMSWAPIAGIALVLSVGLLVLLYRKYR